MYSSQRDSGSYVGWDNFDAAAAAFQAVINSQYGE
jgi:hypothetical protein